MLDARPGARSQFATGWCPVLPTPGTFYACQAAQPAILREPDGTWHAWFKALQWNPNEAQAPAPCDDVNRTWPYGCDRITGIGHASSDDGAAWTADVLVATTDELEASTGRDVPPAGMYLPDPEAT